MWHNGFFSLIMQDSSGKWSLARAGSYSVDGNTYKETFRYCSVPEYAGASDWQAYELKVIRFTSRLSTKWCMQMAATKQANLINLKKKE
jgi:hypothetical protein